LIALQVSPSEQPRRLLRHGSCAFSRVLRMFQESLSSAKLFLISALREAVIAVLAEDDLYLDTDAERAVIRFPPEERSRHFGKEGTPEYTEKISKYKDFATDKLRSLVARFVSGIRTSVFCFPEHLRWVIRELYAVLTAGHRFSEGEVGALCTDLIFGHFICHAVMNPELYGIIDMHVTTIARFNLMQIAQIIQILAMSKFEKGSDSRFCDILKSFMEQDGSKSNLSNIIDILIESGTNESLSPQDNISRCLKDVTRTCILVSEQQLYSLTNFLHDVSSSEKISDETRSSLQQLLNGIPRHNKVTNESCPPPATETNTKKGGLLDKVRNKTKDTLKESTGSTEHLISCPEILVIPIGGDSDNVLLGMLPEEKVLEIAIQTRQVKVRMNLGDGELESVASGSVLSEKRTRFSQDQESIGTCDNLEAISEAASTHSGVESSLDTEDEDADCCVDVNEGDNLSDMVSANVSSGRGTPNVSGRDTPSESSEAGAGDDDDGQDPGAGGGGGGAIGCAIGGGQRVVVHVNQPDEDDQPGSEQIANAAGGDGKIVKKPPTLRTACRPAPAPPLNAIPVVHPRRPNTQNDIEEKFGKFDCKPSSTIMSALSADETKSLLSDTWSTDVLASDTEGVEQACHGDYSHGLMVAAGGPGIGHGVLHAINQSLEISETASQSDAWSTDVLMSDTERLQEFIDMDDSSATGEAVGSDVTDGPGGDPCDIPEPQPQPDSQIEVKLRSHKSTPRNSSGDSSTAGDPTSGTVEQEATLNSLTTSMTQTLGRISFDLRQKNLFSLKDDDDLTMTEVQGLVMSLSHPQTTSTPTRSVEGRRGHRTSISELLTSLDSSTGNASSSGGTAVAGDLNNSVCDEQSFSLIDFEKEIAEVDGVPFPVRSNTLTAENASSNLIDFLSEEVEDQVKTNGQATAVEDKSNRASTGAIPKNPLRLRGSKNSDRSVSLDSEPRSGSGGGGFFKLPNIKNKFQEKIKSFKDKRTSMSSIIPSVSTRSSGISNGSFVENNASTINPSNETTDDILEKYRRKRSQGEVQSAPLDADFGAIGGNSIGALKPSSNIPGDISPSGMTSSTDSVFGTVGITKRKLRRVLSSVDIHGLPITCIQSVSSSGAHIFSDAHSELVMFLRLLLSEAKHLNNSQQVVALQEAIRVVESLDEKSCQQLFWSLREDYQRRAPYISYLISSRQTLLSTEAHFDSLYNHLMQEKLTCLHNLVTVCVKQFLEKKEKAVAHFIRYFQIPGTADEKVQLVEKFLEYLFQSMDSDPVWQMASQDMVDHAKEVIERVIMSQVYMFALYPNGDGDVLRDQILQQHIARLSRTVTLAHPDLKIPKVYHSEAPWPAAQEEIWTINAFKTPKEKVLCVVRTCSIIMSLLSLANDRSVPAADDLVPVLVFVVIKANPPSLLSTVEYVNSFYEGHFEGEEAYWWTQFSSVVQLIKTMDYQ